MNNIRSLDLLPMDFVRALNRIGDFRIHATPIISEAIDFGSSDMLRVIWGELDGLARDNPVAIVGDKDVLADLLPRILALPGVALPITAFMRTWQSEDFVAGAKLAASPLNNVATLGFVGLIVAELKDTIGPDVDLKMMGMDSVRRTLSFVCAQAAARGWTHKTLDTIMTRWLEARILSDNDDFSAILIHVKEYSGFLQNLDRKFAAKDIRESLAAEIQSWVDLKRPLEKNKKSVRLVGQAVKSLKGLRSREGRYDILMDIINQSRNSNDMLDPLEHGFLLSLIEPGSLDFLDLAHRSGPDSIAISASYCMFAAILGGETMLGKFSAFGWNIIRSSGSFEAELPFDISLSELRVLNDARRTTAMAFRTRSPSLIDVELAPNVSGSFGNPARRKNVGLKPDETAAEIERQQILHDSVVAAFNALEVANRMLQSRKTNNQKYVSPQKRIY